MIKVSLKNDVKEFESGVSVLDVAKSISEGLARSIVAAEVDGEVVGLDTVLDKDCSVNLLKFEDKEGREVFRHTSSHILAQAIKRLYPEAKLAIGPAIDNGFYYDIDLEHSLVPEDLEALEKVMKKIEDKEGREVFRHTSSHILAQAIKRLYPEAKLAIGPAIDNGFYYDIDLEHSLVPEDLEALEKVMKKMKTINYN